MLKAHGACSEAEFESELDVNLTPRYCVDPTNSHTLHHQDLHTKLDMSLILNV